MVNGRGYEFGGAPAVRIADEPPACRAGARMGRQEAARPRYAIRPSQLCSKNAVTTALYAHGSELRTVRSARPEMRTPRRGSWYGRNPQRTARHALMAVWPVVRPSRTRQYSFMVIKGLAGFALSLDLQQASARISLAFPTKYRLFGQNPVLRSLSGLCMVSAITVTDIAHRCTSDAAAGEGRLIRSGRPHIWPDPFRVL
jgi:hypothetical protein